MSENRVVIVGRPNVGKSSIINALVNRRAAIVDDLPGVTRDINYFDIEHNDICFKIADTGGLHLNKEDDKFISLIENGILQELIVADLIIFVVDGRQDINHLDREIATMIRKNDLFSKTILAANKIDHDAVVYENYYELGFSELFPISSAHRRGLSDLLDEVVKRLPGKKDKSKKYQEKISISIVGRPNAGKSSLLNALISQERAIVSDIQGTTRDPINETMLYHNNLLEFIDTAGFRRRTRDNIEYYSVNRAYQAIDHSDLVLLIFDPEEFAADLESKLARYIESVKKGIIFVVNKSDTLSTEQKQELQIIIKRKLYYLDFAPVIFVSALHKKGLGKLLTKIMNVYDNFSQEIPTSYLNKVLKDIYESTNPPSNKGKSLKLYFCSQVKAKPPYFVFSVNQKSIMTTNYQRYLEKQFRKHFDLSGVPFKYKYNEH